MGERVDSFCIAAKNGISTSGLKIQGSGFRLDVSSGFLIILANS